MRLINHREHYCIDGLDYTAEGRGAAGRGYIAEVTESCKSLGNEWRGLRVNLILKDHVREGRWSVMSLRDGGCGEEGGRVRLPQGKGRKMGEGDIIITIIIILGGVVRV